MLENFGELKSKNGIVYGILQDFGKGIIRIMYKNKSYVFKSSENINLQNFNVGDFVRLVIKDSVVVYMEKIPKEYSSLYSRLIDKTNRLYKSD